MEFSLEGLFAQLNKVINSVDKDDTEKLSALINRIEWWQQYAIQCGQLEDTQNQTEV